MDGRVGREKGEDREWTVEKGERKREKGKARRKEMEKRKKIKNKN